MVRPPFGTTVPGNRWDAMADATPSPLPSISVVVTHYRQPRELARTLAALDRQDYPADLVQVIVADDGSPTTPAVPAGVELVRQEDRGFRAAAVRNLGVRRATGDLLCFLDADTTPEPQYLRRMTRLPALLPETVTVGRRRHADLGDHPPDEPIETVGPARALAEPAWLAEAYARSRNLLDADDRSYRYVIGAAFACTRWFFDDTGGFDESFDEYGGEDWEWANRAWQNGGLLAHVPDAVAWHDGPEWAGRNPDPEERVRRGNVQTLRLTGAIPVDGSRGRGVLTADADVVFRLRGRHSDASTFICVDAVLAAFPRARVELEHGSDAPMFADDPRVHQLGWPLSDARVTVDLTRPIALPREPEAGGLIDRFRALGSGEEGALELWSTDGEALGSAVSRRARRRRERWGDGSGFETARLAVEGAVALREHPRVEPYVGGWGGPEHLR